LQNFHPYRFLNFKTLTVLLIFSACLLGPGAVEIIAQEDTTRVDRQGPERIEEVSPQFRTPMNFGIPESSMNRYRLPDRSGADMFHRRLRSEGVEDFLFRQPVDDYDPYGPEWEREINEQIMAIVEEMYGDTHPLLGIVNRIVPFLGIGFFTNHRMPPPPRIEHENMEIVD